MQLFIFCDLKKSANTKAHKLSSLFITLQSAKGSQPINSWSNSLKIAFQSIPQSQHLLQLTSEHQKQVDYIQWKLVCQE